MYQVFVLGLGALLVFGTGYFIQHSDQSGVLESTLAATAVDRLIAGAPGIYLCDTDSKCEYPRVLELATDGTFKMTTTFEGGVETLVEYGTWKIGNDGAMDMMLMGTLDKDYPLPIPLPIKRVSQKTIIGGSGSAYENWANVIFKRDLPEEEEIGTVEAVEAVVE